MPEREERDHDLRGQVRQLAKVVNNQVKRNARLEKQFAEFQKESSTKALVGAVDRVATAIQHSKGDMTTEQEQAFMAETAAGIAKNTQEIEDAQKETPTKGK